MSEEYKAIPVDKLFEPPTRRQMDRAKILSDSLTHALNKMAKDGWELVSPWKSANGTIFIFKRSA